MQTTLITKGGLTLTILLISIGLMFITHHYTKQSIKKGKAKKQRAKIVTKTINTLISVFALTIIFFLWGINLSSVWVMITSILALIAVGFLATWSILSNILAGIFLFFSGIVRTGDTIEIHPEKIKGKITSASILFCELEDTKGNKFYIPNNLFFQKYIKKIK